ncbi:MAG: pyrroloquinoline quinone biosynthesis protein PqqE [Deltaproteobacteria bacterium]|nr:pyrroloquinoline quinone biosynthesis protein PqqE [Deltaproteobacteria bacterium]
MAAPRPYTLVAELTYRCPLRCPYCSNPIDLQLKKGELTTEQWCQVFSDAAELGVIQLHLSGGEPTVRKDLPELIRHARKCDLYTNLITGGTLVSEDDLREFRDCGLDHVQLSIQDTDRETAELIAGVRSYDKKLEVARQITKLGLPLTLNVVVHRYNIGHVPELIALGAELGAQRLELANSQYVSWALQNRNTLLPTQAQRDEAAAIAREARERYRGKMEIVFVQVDYLTKEPKPCMGGWARTYMLITPTGEVLPCHAAHTIPNLHFDNVQQQSLKTIWPESPALNAFRGDAWMEEPCRSCPNKAKDFGGCRCQAFLLTGDPAATDPVCHLSPRHDVIVEAIATAEHVDNAPLVYRDQKNSERLLSRL